MIIFTETAQQVILFSVIIFAFVFWIWGKIRYDIVALIALSFLIIGGIIDYKEAFLGFSNPAVIIVATILVMSRGIINTGFIDYLITKLPIKNKPVWLQIFVLTTITAVMSAFVYNIGALAIVMPLAIITARRKKVSSALYLMPIAFAANIGGFLTLIGNAPNIIVSSFRTDLGIIPFGMFDYGKVGIFILIATILFISIIGWRLIPKRKSARSLDNLSQVENYTSELFVTEGSDFIGKSITDLKGKIEDDFSILAIIRGDRKIMNPKSDEIIIKEDLILVKANAEIIRQILNFTDLKLSTPKEKSGDNQKEFIQVEAVISPASRIIGFALEQMKIDFRYNVEVVAISRQDENITDKIKEVKIKVGDILLLRGKEDDINQFLSIAKMLSLAEKNIHLKPTASIAFALLIFSGAILLTIFNVFPAEINFFLGAILMISLGVLSPKEAYENIDWPIIITLGAMIPFGTAVVSSGSADLISKYLLDISVNYSSLFILGIVLGVTMILSNFINNVGAAVLMAPIAILLAQGLNVSIDPFLMAVAIGGSCAFLTPVAHQVNLLVMRPGGYHFTDFWKMGLWLNIIIFFISIILLPIFWPL